MALINDLNNREFDKFREDKSGKPAIAIVIDELEPTNPLNNNSSALISYNAAGEAVYVDEIISGTTYRTTFTRSDMTIGSTLPISAAVEI